MRTIPTSRRASAAATCDTCAGSSEDAVTLWVCFAEPSTAVPADVLVLSFLPPGDEQRWAELLGERLVRGREALQDVRPRARRAYLDLIARLGAAPCVRGRSLRQELRGSDGTSRWWFLKVSEKDCVW